MDRFRKLLQTCALGLAVTLTGCSQTTTEVNEQLVEAQEILTNGLNAIQLGEYDLSKVYLARLVDDTDPLAIALATEENLLNQARFSFVMANTLNELNETIESVANLLELIENFQGGDSEAPLFPQAGEGVLAPVVNGIVGTIHDFFAENRELLVAIQQSEDFSVDFSSLPIKIAGLKILDAGGEYDLGEVHIFDSFTQLIMGFMKALLALDYTINLNNIPIDYLVEAFGEMADSEDIMSDILNIVAVIFYSQPDILALGSVEDMQRAGELYSGAFASFLAALNGMIAETDDQSDDLFAYVPAEGSESQHLVVRIEPEPLVLPGIDTTEFADLEIRFDDEFLANIETIQNSFAGIGNVRISWANDVVPLIAITVDTFLSSGALNGLIYAVLQSACLEEDTLESILQLISNGFLDAALLEGLIQGLIPDIFEFDMGAYFQNPQNAFREYLPYWTVPTSTSVYNSSEMITETITHWEDMTLLMEWECEDGSGNTFTPPLLANQNATGFYCGTGNTPIDTDHFVDAPYYTDDFEEEHADYINNLKHYTDANSFGYLQDGISSPLPYIAFQDPTFGQILWIKLDENAIERTNDFIDIDDEFRLANNRTLNALIHGWFTGLLETFDLGDSSDVTTPDAC